MEVFLIRHGETDGNLGKLYVGSTDLPLCEQGIDRARALAATGVLPELERVYVSPLQRARQTAAILFPQAVQAVIDDLREIDFGDFEGKGADELSGNPAYQAWVDALCETPCPHGEDRLAFEARVFRAFKQIVDEALASGEKQLAVVSHGGVGMAVMGRWARPQHPNFAWYTPNCAGHVVTIEQPQWADDDVFASWAGIGVDSWRNKGYSFFTNPACEYFPCHETDRPEDFNCLFCFCPLYTLGEACGGSPSFTGEGVKSCVECSLPHHRDSYGTIFDRLVKNLESPPS